MHNNKFIENRWQFISTGGCTRCNAMAGLYKNKPSKPHVNCRCRIAKAKTVKSGKKSCYTLTMQRPVIQDVIYNKSKKGYDIQFLYGFTFQCNNARSAQSQTGGTVTGGSQSHSQTRWVFVKSGAKLRSIQSIFQASAQKYENQAHADAKRLCEC